MYPFKVYSLAAFALHRSQHTKLGRLALQIYALNVLGKVGHL